MRLEGVVIENFLSFKERQCFSLCGEKIFLVGENGSGKSNVIRAISLVIEHWNTGINWGSPPLWKRTEPTFVLLKFRLEEKDKELLCQIIQFALLPTSTSSSDKGLSPEELERRFGLAKDALKKARFFETVEIGLIGDGLEDK